MLSDKEKRRIKWQKKHYKKNKKLTKKYKKYLDNKKDIWYDEYYKARG